MRKETRLCNWIVAGNMPLPPLAQCLLSLVVANNLIYNIFKELCLFWLISSILSNLHKVSALGHALAVSYVEEALLSNFSFFVFSLAGSMP